MNRTSRSVTVADPLWTALETMSREMGVDRDVLVNQAIFALARQFGFITPTQVSLLDGAAASPQAAVPVAPPQVSTGAAMQQASVSFAPPQVASGAATPQASVSFAPPQVASGAATPQASAPFASPQVASGAAMQQA
ncbi:hypothetical protein ACLESD_47580, partial [Pyxidicoccus sp. 3LFB2]